MVNHERLYCAIAVHEVTCSVTLGISHKERLVTLSPKPESVQMFTEFQYKLQSIAIHWTLQQTI